MTNKIFNLFGKFAFSAVLISAANAQTDGGIQAKVPFSFSVQHSALASGSYKMTYNDTGHALTITKLDGASAGVIATAIPVAMSSETAEPSRLIFECHEKSCQLSEVWTSSHQRSVGFKLVGGEDQSGAGTLKRTVIAER